MLKMSGNLFGCYSCGDMTVMASSGYRSQMLGNLLQCTGEAPTTVILHKMSVPRVRNPVLEYVLQLSVYNLISHSKGILKMDLSNSKNTILLDITIFKLKYISPFHNSQESCLSPKSRHDGKRELQLSRSLMLRIIPHISAIRSTFLTGVQTDQGISIWKIFSMTDF